MLFTEHNELPHAPVRGIVMTNFSDISTRNELAEFIGVPIKKLTHILYVKKPDSYYKTFEIPKKSGGFRKICAPSGDLKSIQIRLYKALCLYRNSTKKNCKCNISHAFEEDKGIITNATVHRNKRFVVNIDLKDFFDSIHFGRVCGYFQNNSNFNLSYEVSVILAQLMCFKGRLPQGAPTSPIMTNLICEILDMQLLKIAKDFRLDYTRYADDLTFSTNDRNFLEKYDSFLCSVKNQVEHAGFLINDKKTRIQYKDSKQKVTGLVVNDKIQVDRDYYKETRAMAHNLYINGEFEIGSKSGTLEQLEGRFAFIDQLCKYNNKNDKRNHRGTTLCGREKEYRQFLFYKYFYSNKKPLIITEGKTDILYIKAALKSLSEDYPELIESKGNGEFVFKVSFLNRTSRLAYFFDYSVDGADGMGVLCKFFVDTDNNYPNYYEKFNRLCNRKDSNPVIFVFDNELSNKEKPISKFFKQKDFKSKKEEISKELVVRLTDKANLYLVTNPLVGNNAECEIEELFDQSVRDVKINGKELSLSNDPDFKTQYGKDVFSRYIMSNYKTIDFSNFKPMLDKIRDIIISYTNVD